MVDSCDLYVLLSKSRSLRSVGIYCRVVKEIGRPSALNSNVILQDGGKFVEAEIFAVDLYASRIRETFGIISESDRFLVNANISLYVDARLSVNDWYYFQGTLCMNTNASKIPLCTLMNTKKSGSSWILYILSAKDFEISHFVDTRRQYSVLQYCITNSKVIPPADVARFTRLYAEVPDSFMTSSESIVNTSEYCEKEPTPSPRGIEPKGLGRESLEHLPSGTGMPMQETTVESCQSDATPVLMARSNKSKETRSEIKTKPEVFNELEECVKGALSVRKEYVQSLKKKYPVSDDLDLVRSLIGNIERYWKSKPSRMGMTGKTLLKKYIEKSGEDVEQEYMGESLVDYFLDIRAELFDYLLAGSSIVAEGDALEIAKALFADPDVFYAGIVSNFTDIGYDKAVNIARTLLSYGVSFARVFSSNPYLLTICGLGVNFASAEKIAYTLGVWSDEGIQDSRNVAILSDYMVYGDSQDTNYCVDDIKGATLGVRLTKIALDKLKSGESVVSQATVDNASAYLGANIVQYPKTGWIFSDGYYYLPLELRAKETAICDAEEVGILIRKTVCGQDMLLCTEFLQMELFILNKCYKLAGYPSRYNDSEKIDRLISKYEEMKGFKLEQAQRQGVITSVSNNISAISGPAGSGKTTTSDCLVYVYTHWDCEDDSEESSDIDIRYAAPTGKAAKRLQEVVHRPVRTMHSEFKVGIGEKTLLDVAEDDDDYVDEGAKIYIFDEVAMVPLRLMYTVLSRTGKASIVLLGDICQLSPIGKGLPFRDLLKFIPCTFLLVSKRSLEGSGLTLNSNIINESSGAHNFKYLENSDDFKLVECGDDEIANKIYTICGYHLGKVTKDRAEQVCGVPMISTEAIVGIKPDEIQCVMPISTDKYSWGASCVNERLQDLFNPKDSRKKEFKIQNFKKERVYRVGDRVIHTNSNMYSMQWYESFDGKSFQMAWGSGIMNGDVGKIVDIVEATRRLKFLNPEGDPPDGYEEPRHKLRKDKSWRGENHYFVVVKYYDYGSDSNYYILYQAVADGYARGSGLYLTGEDLTCLDLSYALTTHKMQGSQSKLIVYGLGKVRRQGFVTRNAVYTGETRAGRGEYMVGSVHATMTSQLNVARGIVEQEGVSTVLGDVWDSVKSKEDKI